MNQESADIVALGIDRAHVALGMCESVSELQDVHGRAAAVQQYAKTALLGLEMQNRAAEVKLRAARRAGGLLHEMHLRGRRRRDSGKNSMPTLKELGVTQNQSTRWQRLARISSGMFEHYLQRCVRGEVEISLSGLFREVSDRRSETALRRKYESAQPCQTSEELKEQYAVLERLVRSRISVPSDQQEEHIVRLLGSIRQLIAELALERESPGDEI